jgi:pimeloyl-ACP methyl ester carboxylesterase
MQTPSYAPNLQPAVPAETLHVAVSGEGEPIVLIPGLLGAGFGFRSLIPLLNEAGFRTVVVDLPGTGRSSRPRDSDYSLESHAGRIEFVLDTLGISEASVIAHAIGGSIALRLASRRPDLIANLLLLEGGPAESISTAGLRKAMKFRRLIKILGAGALRGRIRDQMVEASGDPSWVAESVVEGYTMHVTRDLSATLRAMKAMASSRETDSVAPRLSTIAQPVHLLVGGVPHKGAPSEDEVAMMAATLRAFTVDTVPGVGHFIQEEVPQLVCEAVRFMRRGRIAAARESGAF